MKISEIRLYKLKVIKDNEVIYEGMAEDLPEELKMADSKAISIENGEAVIDT